MKHFYNANTQQDEDLIRNMVFQTISSLRGLPEQIEVAKVALDSTSAHVLAGLIEIGVAPEGSPIIEDMRDRANRFGQVKLQMSRSYALDLAKHIELGMLRHENGVNDPATFTLH